MPNPYVLPLALLVCAVILFLMVRRSARSARFAKAMNATVSEDGAGEKTVHLSTPRGEIDLQVHASHDSGMESMPKYPGATPMDTKFEYEMKVKTGCGEGRYFEQGFWTADASAEVTAFYEREFAEWKKDSQFMVGQPGGRRYVEQTAGRIRTVEVRWDLLGLRDAKPFPEARTVIRYSVAYGDHLPTVPTR